MTNWDFFYWEPGGFFLQVLSNLLTHLIFAVKEPKIITQLKWQESKQTKRNCVKPRVKAWAFIEKLLTKVKRRLLGLTTSLENFWFLGASHPPYLSSPLSVRGRLGAIARQASSSSRTGRHCNIVPGSCKRTSRSARLQPCDEMDRHWRTSLRRWRGTVMSARQRLPRNGAH